MFDGTKGDCWTSQISLLRLIFHAMHFATLFAPVTIVASALVVSAPVSLFHFWLLLFLLESSCIMLVVTAEPILGAVFPLVVMTRDTVHVLWMLYPLFLWSSIAFIY